MIRKIINIHKVQNGTKNRALWNTRLMEQVKGWPTSTTFILWFVREAKIIEYITSDTPYDWSLWSRPLCHTTSKAFKISKGTHRASPLSSNALVKWSVLQDSISPGGRMAKSILAVSEKFSPPDGWEVVHWWSIQIPYLLQEAGWWGNRYFWQHNSHKLLRLLRFLSELYRWKGNYMPRSDQETAQNTTV